VYILPELTALVFSPGKIPLEYRDEELGVSID
jgi:hypothetical protein